MSKIKKWAKNLIKDVFYEWKLNYSSWKSGFKVFYGPVRKNPELLILSFNPGGTEKSFMDDFNRFTKGDFSLPKINSYILRDYPMAKKMKNLFEENELYLKHSVAFPILFFRSKNVQLWKSSLSNKKRKRMEQFCYSLVKEIFREIQPKKILVIGFATYNRMKKHLFGNLDDDILYGRNNRKLSYSSHLDGKPLLCILHPTGNRISNEDWEKIKLYFQNFIRK